MIQQRRLLFSHQIPREHLGRREALEQAGIGVEVMSTGAACRTYNILVTEGRRVAALLLVVR